IQAGPPFPGRPPPRLKPGAPWQCGRWLYRAGWVVWARAGNAWAAQVGIARDPDRSDRSGRDVCLEGAGAASFRILAPLCLRWRHKPVAPEQLAAPELEFPRPGELQ